MQIMKRHPKLIVTSIVGLGGALTYGYLKFMRRDKKPMKMMSLFQKIGGMEKCQELADKIVETLLTDPLLKKKFVNADNHLVIEHIKNFLADTLGVQGYYHGRNLAEVHGRLGIQTNEYDILMITIEQELKNMGYSDELSKEIRQEIDKATRSDVVSM